MTFLFLKMHIPHCHVHGCRKLQNSFPFPILDFNTSFSILVLIIFCTTSNMFIEISCYKDNFFSAGTLTRPFPEPLSLLIENSLYCTTFTLIIQDCPIKLVSCVQQMFTDLRLNIFAVSTDLALSTPHLYYKLSNLQTY